MRYELTEVIDGPDRRRGPVQIDGSHRGGLGGIGHVDEADLGHDGVRVRQALFGCFILRKEAEAFRDRLRVRIAGLVELLANIKGREPFEPRGFREGRRRRRHREHRRRRRRRPNNEQRHRHHPPRLEAGGGGNDSSHPIGGTTKLHDVVFGGVVDGGDVDGSGSSSATASDFSL